MYKQIASNRKKTAALIIFFIALIGVIGYIYGIYTETGYYPVILAVIFASISAVFSYYFSDSIALAMSGARQIKREDNKELFRIIETLCITTGLPMPRVYVINDPAPNAFATGRNPKSSAIAVTSGLLDIMERRQLEGVIAHELSHIKNYDILIMTITVVMVGTLTLISDWLLRSRIRSSVGNRNEGNIGIILLLIGLALAILSPIIASMIKLAISRKREYLADADAALITRFPDGLAEALEKIKDYGQPLARANNATAHLYISSPFSRKTGIMSNLFSTHPPVDDRIRVLREMIGRI